MKIREKLLEKIVRCVREKIQRGDISGNDAISSMLGPPDSDEHGLDKIKVCINWNTERILFHKIRQTVSKR